MERSQCHSQTQISIIYFIPQEKKGLKEQRGGGLRAAVKVRLSAWGFRDRGVEEGNHRRITSEGVLCFS